MGGASHTATDADLLARLGEDRAAFEQFYRRHFAAVTRFLARRCDTPEDVADATSATFLAVMLSGSTYRPAEGAVATWLFAVAANEARRLHRRGFRDAALLRRVRGRGFLNSDDTERLAEMIDAERQAAILQLMITEAPTGQQQFINQMVADNLTPTEAARALGISTGAGRVRLTRLRKMVASATPNAYSPAEADGANRHMEEKQ
jgi:RNA polymerase sigma factor (sigma-70 family)